MHPSVPAHPRPAGDRGVAASNEFVAALLGSAGSASFAAPIPNDPSFLGLQFSTQGLVADPGWNPLGAVLSVAREATVGS